MEITLKKASINDINELYEMQICSFASLYAVYHDDETIPAKESMENLMKRMKQPESTHYKILADGTSVGALRIKKMEAGRYHLSQINILPKWQGQGIAQKALSLMEKEYIDATVWELETILQEERNCYLYEKMGYKQTGDKKVINKKMTIVSYEKHLAN